jgi:hypothetical protein
MLPNQDDDDEELHFTVEEAQKQLDVTSDQFNLLVERGRLTSVETRFGPRIDFESMLGLLMRWDGRDLNECIQDEARGDCARAYDLGTSYDG